MSTTAIFLVISFVLFLFLIDFILAVYFMFFYIIPTLLGGAFFAKSKQEIIDKMVLFSNVKPSEKAVDLGSGDGRLLIALAKRGAEAHGYEINPFLVRLSRKNIKKEGLADRAFVHFKNFWSIDFSQFNVVTVYGISFIMKNLELKLKKELKPGSRVVSNHFVFPDWQYKRSENNVYLYEK